MKTSGFGERWGGGGLGDAGIIVSTRCAVCSSLRLTKKKGEGSSEFIAVFPTVEAFLAETTSSRAFLDRDRSPPSWHCLLKRRLLFFVFLFSLR